jgi:mRNA interferase MazF
MAVVVKRFAVYLANFDPTIGSEIQKTSPCLVISPDEMIKESIGDLPP